MNHFDCDESMATSKNSAKNNSLKKKSRLNHFVFWPPFLLLLTAVILNFVAPSSFQSATNYANDWILTNVGWLFSLVAFAAVVTCAVVCFSKFGEVRIGGRNAKPLMNMGNWFAITICTTIAVGILLWATVEPISHFHSPPESKGIDPASPESATFAMSTMYLHWTFTPYAIYAVASLMFAFSYYNMKLPYSLGSPMAPFLGKWFSNRSGNIIDSLCLYSLAAGMAASLGGGILVLGGGIGDLFPAIDGKSVYLWAAIALVIITTFVISSATGLMNGIRILSTINAYALVVLALFVFICGPTIFILNFGLESFGVYLTNFFEMNLSMDSLTQIETDDTTGKLKKGWARGWTVFYWAVWMAWTPITACFLGQIAYGRTVREFMLVNFILPSLFGAAWMAIFSGMAIHLEMTAGANFQEYLKPDENGNVRNELVMFALFEFLPMTTLLTVFYIGSTFICFVTSADSNTTAMAAISSDGITPENTEGGLYLKVAWGLTVGLVAWVMITFADIEGIKIISVLGGFPSAILIIFMIGSLIKVLLNYEEYNVVDKEDDAVKDN